MDATKPPAAIVDFYAIAHDNTMVHTFPNVPSMLPQNDIALNGRFGGIDFFGPTGRRLAPVFGKSWELVGLAETAEQVNPSVLVQRLVAVVEHLERFINLHPEVVKKFNMTPEQAIAALPSLEGESLETALVFFPHRQPPTDTGGWWHNLLHAGGWTHG